MARESRFVIRPFNPKADFSTLTQLHNEAAKADLGTSTTETEQRELKELYEQHGQFWQWILELPQTETRALIAYASLFKQAETPYGEFSLMVHPEFRQQRLESPLLRAIVAEARVQQAQYISALIDAQHKYLQTFLLSQGFKTEGGYRAMQMDFVAPLPTPTFPAGFVLRTYDQVNDIKILVDITNRGWSDLPGHKIASEETIDWINHQPYNGIFLLFNPENKVIGCTSAKINQDDQGQLDSPGLAPEHRQPEMYRAMALAGLQYLIKQSCKAVKLESWGDYDSTIATYTELGFQTTIHEIGYRLDLPGVSI